MCPPSCAEEVCNHDDTEQVSASHSKLEEQDSEQSWQVAFKGHLDCGLFCMFLWSGQENCSRIAKCKCAGGPLAQWSGSSRADSHLCCNACRRGHPIYHCFFTPAFSAVGEVSLSGHKQTKDFPHRQHACIPSYHQARDLLWDYVVATDSGTH